MWLRSTVAQQVRVADLELEVNFDAAEEMLTEISTKFTPQGLEAELVASGFVVDSMWESEGGEFLMTLASPYC